MRTKEITLYQFSELSEESQQNAIEEYRQSRDIFPWWYESTYEDAKEVGIEIKSFDAGRKMEIELQFTDSPEATAHSIIDSHGQLCNTYEAAQEYLAERQEILDTAPKDEDGEYEDEYELDGQLDKADVEFRLNLGECYLSILLREWEYQHSDECIGELLQANEYEFTEDGKMYT